MLILSAVRHAGHHLKATDILEDVRRTYPYVDASTVYRTLGSAAELGLVTGTDMGAGDTEFEWVGTDRHHHLIAALAGASHLSTIAISTAWPQPSTTTSASRLTSVISPSSDYVTAAETPRRRLACPASPRFASPPPPGRSWRS
jgi:hypothetical protein